jgi:hypothetical protein
MQYDKLLARPEDGKMQAGRCVSRNEVEESKVLAKGYYLWYTVYRSRNPNPEKRRMTIIMLLVKVQDLCSLLLLLLLLLLTAEEASHVAACTLCAFADLAGTG